MSSRRSWKRRSWKRRVGTVVEKVMEEEGLKVVEGGSATFHIACWVEHQAGCMRS